MKTLSTANSFNTRRTVESSPAKIADNLAKFLDDGFRIPGTRIRFGWDGIIGLIPGVGDAAAGLLALVPVAIAYKSGASRWLLARMISNVAIDTAIGAVPIVGDVFDIFFRSNRRNAKLLAEYYATRRSS